MCAAHVDLYGRLRVAFADEEKKTLRTPRALTPLACDPLQGWRVWDENLQIFLRTSPAGDAAGGDTDGSLATPVDIGRGY